MTPSGPESALRNTTDCKIEFVKKNRRENEEIPSEGEHVNKKKKD